MNRDESIKRLSVLLREACRIYEELMEDSRSEQERRDWAIDAEDVERAANYADAEAANI